MKSVLWKSALLGLVLFAPLCAGCESDDGGGHSVKLGGVGHRDGYTDPLSACASCHGATLQGGDGPGCFNCHDANDHLTVRSGVRHNQPGVDCSRCHGPSRTRGGLGPGCVQSGCHAS